MSYFPFEYRLLMVSSNISLGLPERRIPVIIFMSGVPSSSIILSRDFVLVIIFI